MMPLESSLSDTTIWSVTLELSITILQASFDNPNMFIAQATCFGKAFKTYFKKNKIPKEWV